MRACSAGTLKSRHADVQGRQGLRLPRRRLCRARGRDRLQRRERVPRRRLSVRVKLECRTASLRSASRASSAARPRRIPTQIDIHPAQLCHERKAALDPRRGARNRSPPYQLPIPTVAIPFGSDHGELRGHDHVGRVSLSGSAVDFRRRTERCSFGSTTSTQGFPTARVDARSAEQCVARTPGGIRPAAFGFGAAHVRINQDAPNGSLVASSGERLVVYRAPATFNLITTPATATSPRLRPMT